MSADNFGARTYDDFMAAGGPFITLHVDFKRPIELGDFISGFAALSSQYQKFMHANYPDLAPDADIYVKEIRPGSLEADLLPWATNVGLPTAIHVMEQALVVENFVRTYGGRLANYFKKGGRDETASKADLKDFMGAVAAIANDPKGKSRLEAVIYKDDKRQVLAAIKFDTKQAVTAREEIQKHQKALEHHKTAGHSRVLLTFSQSNIKDISIGKKSGEKVVVASISDRALPLIYASDLTEQRIKHEIREADDNVYKKGFVVDVTVEMLRDKPVAYRVTDLHDVIDLPDA